MNTTEDKGKTTSEDALIAAALRLPKEIPPERDLWPAIAQALESQRPQNRRWNAVFAQAAAVLLLVGASSAVTYVAITDGRNEISPVATDAVRIFEPVSGSFGSQYNLGPDFQDARNKLAARLDDELQKLSPEARADVEQNLALIRAAIVEINTALADEPDNPLLQELLLRTYHDELTVMRRVSGMSNPAMVRTDI